MATIGKGNTIILESCKRWLACQGDQPFGPIISRLSFSCDCFDEIIFGTFFGSRGGKQIDSFGEYRILPLCISIRGVLFMMKLCHPGLVLLLLSNEDKEQTGQ